MKKHTLCVGLIFIFEVTTSCKARTASNVKMGPPNAITDAEFPSVLHLVRQNSMLVTDPSLYPPVPDKIRLDEHESCFATVLSSSVLVTAEHCYREVPPLVVTASEVIEPDFTVFVERSGENQSFSDVRLLIFKGEPFKNFPGVTIYNLNDEIKLPMHVVGHGRPVFLDKESIVSKMPQIPRSKGQITEHKIATKVIKGYEGKALVSIKSSTNTTMAPGDSGGPIFSNGRLVGVLSQKALTHFAEMFPGELTVDVWTILDSKLGEQFLSEAVSLNADIPGVTPAEKCCKLAYKVSYDDGRSKRSEIRKKFEGRLIEQRRYRLSAAYAEEVQKLQQDYLDQKLSDRYRAETRAILQAKLTKIMNEQADKFAFTSNGRRPVVSSIYPKITFNNLSNNDLPDNLQSLLMQDRNFYRSELNFALNVNLANKTNSFIRLSNTDPKTLMETSADFYENGDSIDIRNQSLTTLNLDGAVGLHISMPSFDEFFQKKQEPEIIAVWLWTHKDARRIY